MYLTSRKVVTEMAKQTVKDIASWRKERNGMTQKELAMRSGVTERTIANYERRN